MFHLRFGLQDIIMPGTAKYASDLLVNRGKIYNRQEYDMD